MKRRNPCTLSVRVKNKSSLTVNKIEFLFKPYQTENDIASVKKTYSATGASEVTVGDDEGLYLVPFTGEETLLFEPGQTLYMDTRIELKGSDGSIVYPETSIVPLTMSGTLFEDNAGGN